MTLRRKAILRTTVWLALVVGLVTSVVEPAKAQQPGDDTSVESNVPPAARQLIVAIRSYEPGRSLPQIGAGIVIGRDEGRAYIATALHVVEGADRIWVSFAAAPGDSAAAEIFRQPESGSLDLAVISVPAAAAPAGLSASFDRLGEPSRLATGSEVSPVGCPDEACWGAPSPPDRILIASPIELWFQSDFVKRGSSGGGLFDRWWEVVGLVTTSDPPRARALPIDFVLDQARTWGVPVTLRRPSIPRAGYRTTIGAAILFPTASFSDRFPSSRFDITYMARYPVSVHLGYLRLAPGELEGCPPQDPGLDTLVLARSPCEVVLNAAVAGLGANLVWQRLTVRALLDLGIGWLQGRYDIGGPFTGEGEGLEYVPNYVATQEQTTIVAGGALALEYIVMRRTVLQALGGYWLYDDPFEAEGEDFPEEYDPKIPHWFLGFGLKVGL
jgi:hypothetical protein